jgi:glyoxylase-like metal-dependent hydrolase (beta-lactamase superfamily II)
MTEIKVFEFNPIQVNTYILYDETGECVIIDAGCYGEEEEKELSDFIEGKGLNPVRLLNTHAHTDHILGNNFIRQKYNKNPELHKEGSVFLKHASGWAEMLGIKTDIMQMPEKYLEEGEKIKYGKEELEVVYTPGHADGSVCFISRNGRFVITGDVLFSGSIGRSDLPTGDSDKLKNSIIEKLYILDDDFIVYPGHGPATTIGQEKRTNPFVKQ